MGLLSFLFGSGAKIFNAKGKVQHDLGEKKWQEWDKRLKENPNYNWRNHTGKQAPKKKEEE